jgi:hypothetical protein
MPSYQTQLGSSCNKAKTSSIVSKIKVPIPYSTPLIVATFRSKGHVQLSLHYEYTAFSAQCLWRIFWWSLSNPRIKQGWLTQQLHCFFIKEKDFWEVKTKPATCQAQGDKTTMTTLDLRFGYHGTFFKPQNSCHGSQGHSWILHL